VKFSFEFISLFSIKHFSLSFSLLVSCYCYRYVYNVVKLAKLRYNDLNVTMIQDRTILT
jgi:hypothetical protein